MVQIKYIKGSIKFLKCSCWIGPVIYLLILFSGCEKNGVTCVSEDTLILTPNGNIPVERLKTGDEVYSYDFSRGILVPAKIANIRRGYDRCIRFKTDSGAGLCVTTDHPIYSPETRTYEKALKWISAELSEFYMLEQNKTVKANVTLLPIGSEKVKVFDISVDSPFGNFIANGILVHNKTPPLEVTPPVDDLEIVGTDSGAVTLAWTVPGNETIYAVEYDVRYLDREWQTDEYWTAADTVTGEPIPSAPGSRDTMTVDGLLNSTTYWFGMTTISNGGGFSNVSNIVSGSTQ